MPIISIIRNTIENVLKQDSPKQLRRIKRIVANFYPFVSLNYN